MGLIEELLDRGILAQHSAPVDEIEKYLAGGNRAVYAGFDPTAPSLHVGNLVPIMGMRHFQRAGHTPIAVMGGATGLIGDPSGKDKERELLDTQTIEANLAGQRAQLQHLLDLDSKDNPPIIVNNLDWLASFSFLDFLRDVGKHFRVSEMMNRESVKRRLEGEGLSFTEFSYQLLQGYDFLHLFDQYDCRVQIGGTDQWGNILGGMDLIRKQRQVETYGLTFPLLETATGEKFGKSAGNAIWLDPQLTSPYQFYQYFIRTDDRDVERFLKYFSFRTLDDIREICREHEQQPEKRGAQRLLAEEMTRLVHGDSELNKAQRASEMLFGGEISGLNDRELSEIFADVPSSSIPRDELNAGVPLVDLLVQTGLCKSKNAARQLIQSGGAYINNTRIGDVKTTVSADYLASESIMVLRSGKKSYHLLRVQ